LHDSSERRPGSGRPSLLSPDQGPAQQDHSILSQLDGRPAPARAKPAPRPRDHQRGARLAVLGVALASIATMGWLTFRSVSQPPDATLASAHAPSTMPAPLPSVEAAPAAAVPAATPALVLAETPKPAVIRDDPLAALDPPVRPPAGGAKDLPQARDPEPAAARLAGKDDLASLLDAPPSAATVTTAKPKPAAPDGPRKEEARKKPAADKLARNDKPRASASQGKPKTQQKPAPKKPAQPVDTDVALLAALLAHTKTPASGSAEDIFKRCATNATAAEVQRCRVRVCQGSAKGAAECKSVRISNVSS